MALEVGLPIDTSYRTAVVSSFGTGAVRVKSTYLLMFGMAAANCLLLLLLQAGEAPAPDSRTPGVARAE
jgi:hypothetical protein